jgi:hypothetical protein
LVFVFNVVIGSIFSCQASPADRGSAEELLRKGTKDKVFPFFLAGGDGDGDGDSECESTSKSKCVVCVVDVDDSDSGGGGDSDGSVCCGGFGSCHNYHKSCAAPSVCFRLLFVQGFIEAAARRRGFTEHTLILRLHLTKFLLY